MMVSRLHCLVFVLDFVYHYFALRAPTGGGFCSMFVRLSSYRDCRFPAEHIRDHGALLSGDPFYRDVRRGRGLVYQVFSGHRVGDGGAQTHVAPPGALRKRRAC